MYLRKMEVTCYVIPAIRQIYARSSRQCLIGQCESIRVEYLIIQHRRIIQRLDFRVQSDRLLLNRIVGNLVLENICLT